MSQCHVSSVPCVIRYMYALNNTTTRIDTNFYSTAAQLVSVGKKNIVDNTMSLFSYVFAIICGL